MNKNIWVIPLVLLVLLSATGAFRWDKEPVQSYGKSLKVQALKDRWTNQIWFKLNGSIPEETDSSWENILRGTNIMPDCADYHMGDLFPYFTNTQVDKKADKIKNSSIGRNKLNELNDARVKAQNTKDYNSKGHTQYLILYKKLEYDQGLLKETLDLNNYYGFKRYAFEHGLPVKNDYAVIRRHIPSSIVDACNTWRNANNQIIQIDNQITNIHLWYRSEAIKQLTEQAKTTKTITNIIWIALLALLFVMTLLFYRKGRT